MKRVLLAALFLADPRPVLAGHSCGGGSSGGSSSGGSSSSGTSSSSSNDSGKLSESGSPSATGCIDDTDVHGYRHCTNFGAWAMKPIPRFFLELGSNVRNFGSSLGGSAGAISHGSESFSYRVVMPSGGGVRDVALTTNVRLGFTSRHGLYGGFEGELGGLVSPARASAEMTSTGVFGSPTVDQQHGMLIGAYGIGGYRVAGRLGSIALEGAGGVRSVRYNFASSYHDCETDATIVASRAIVEARARAELWISPWLTAGVTLGSNVIDRNDWMAGVYVGAHSRAFAGTR